MLIRFIETGEFRMSSLLPGLFLIEILVAVTLLLVRTNRRKRFLPMYIGTVIILIAYSLFVPIFRPTGEDFLTSTMMSFTMKFLLVLVLVYACYDIKWTNLLLIGTIAFCAQNLCDNIIGVAMMYVNISSKFWQQLVFLLIFLSVFAAVYSMLYILFMHKTKGEILIKVSSVKAVIFLLLTLFVSNFLNAFINWILLPNMTNVYKSFGKTILMMGNLFIIVLQINYLMMDKMALELSRIHNLWEEDRKTYMLSKERMDALNIRLHDIRHILNRVDEATAKEIRKGLDLSVKDCDWIVETGNGALDVVINEKRLLCEKKGIELTTIADGHALYFMNDVDIYSMFGNIIDNAIESVMKFETEEKKIISLSISRRGGSIYIKEDNYCGGKIKFMNGLPQTTKKDKLNHGFGVKSIAMLARKYNGAYSFAIDRDVFSLEIIIPYIKTRLSLADSA